MQDVEKNPVEDVEGEFRRRLGCHEDGTEREGRGLKEREESEGERSRVADADSSVLRVSLWLLR